MMQDPAMQQPQPAPAPAASGGKDKDPVQMMKDLGDALGQLSQGLEGAEGLPEEAIDHLSNASAEYQQFLSIVGGGGAKGPSAASDMAGGNKGAVPADMPVGKGVKPVPAY